MSDALLLRRETASAGSQAAPLVVGALYERTNRRAVQTANRVSGNDDTRGGHSVGSRQSLKCSPNRPLGVVAVAAGKGVER